MNSQQGNRRKKCALKKSLRIFQSRVYHQNKTYNRRRDNKLVSYLKCATKNCFAKAVFVDGSVTIPENSPQHSSGCHQLTAVEARALFRETIKEMCQQQYWRLKELYNLVSLLHEEAPAHESFDSLRRSMKRWRRMKYPKSPTSFLQFFEQLHAEQYEPILKLKDGHLKSELIEDSNGDQHIIFYNEDFVNNYIQNCKIFIADATYASRPKYLRECYQLFTMMAEFMGYVLPFVWALMSRKTEEAYQAILYYIRHYILTRCFPELILTDYEVGLRNAIKSHFQNARIAGCLVHYDRCLFRKGKEFGIDELIKNNIIIPDIYSRLFSLAYLPAEIIPAEFQRLKLSLPQDPLIRDELNGIYDYYESYWIEQVKPEGFSIFGLHRRTNNFIEGFNNRQQHTLGIKSAPWQWILQLKILISGAWDDAEKLINNHRVSRPEKYSTELRSSLIKDAWLKLDNGSLRVDEFLQIADRFKGNILSKLEDLKLSDFKEEVPVEYKVNYNCMLNSRNDPEYQIDPDINRRQRIQEDVPYFYSLPSGSRQTGGSRVTLNSRPATGSIQQQEGMFSNEILRIGVEQQQQQLNQQANNITRGRLGRPRTRRTPTARNAPLESPDISDSADSAENSADSGDDENQNGAQISMNQRTVPTRSTLSMVSRQFDSDANQQNRSNRVQSSAVERGGINLLNIQQQESYEEHTDERYFSRQPNPLITLHSQSNLRPNDAMIERRVPVRSMPIIEQQETNEHMNSSSPRQSNLNVNIHSRLNGRLNNVTVERRGNADERYFSRQPTPITTLHSQSNLSPNDAMIERSVPVRSMPTIEQQETNEHMNSSSPRQSNSNVNIHSRLNGRLNNVTFESGDPLRAPLEAAEQQEVHTERVNLRGLLVESVAESDNGDGQYFDVRRNEWQETRYHGRSTTSINLDQTEEESANFQEDAEGSLILRLSSVEEPTVDLTLDSEEEIYVIPESSSANDSSEANLNQVDSNQGSTIDAFESVIQQQEFEGAASTSQVEEIIEERAQTINDAIGEQADPQLVAARRMLWLSKLENNLQTSVVSSTVSETADVSESEARSMNAEENYLIVSTSKRTKGKKKLAQKGNQRKRNKNKKRNQNDKNSNKIRKRRNEVKVSRKMKHLIKAKEEAEAAANIAKAEAEAAKAKAEAEKAEAEAEKRVAEEASKAASELEKKLIESYLCVFCCDRQRDTPFQPCNHFVSCYSCVMKLYDQHDNYTPSDDFNDTGRPSLICPICNNPLNVIRPRRLYQN